MYQMIFINACLQYLKVPYKWGGDDPIKGFDCSGFVQECLAMVGLDPAGDQTAQGLHDYFFNKALMNEPGCGSLCFYGSTIRKITHVSIMLDETLCIEAGGGGSKTNSAEDAALQNAYIRVRPHDKRKDLVAILSPNGLPW
jgi:cell wall-associated NlpC family hydrolase